MLGPAKDMPYLDDKQLARLKLLIAREKAVARQLSGDRFEDILCSVLPDCEKKVVNIRDKQWFDLAQPNRGIEAKTYQIQGRKVVRGGSVSNVLKRVAPNLLPADLTTGKGKERQVDTSADPAEVGAAIIEYLNKSMLLHAAEKRIRGDFYFAILFRNPTLTHAGYWEEEVDFGLPSDYDWAWRERSLKGVRDDVEMLTWYWAGGRQLFYRFIAPPSIQLFDIPDYHGKWLDEEELKGEVEEAYHRGYKDGLKAAQEKSTTKG